MSDDEWRVSDSQSMSKKEREKKMEESRERLRNAIKNTEHDLLKEVHLNYGVTLEDDEIVVDDNPLTEREVYGSTSEPFQYGEFFRCACGGAFHDKESAVQHVIENKDN